MRSTSAASSRSDVSARAPRPYTLVAELTYRCPLRCAYCSNPLELARRARELDTADWRRVLAEAEALGVRAGEPHRRRAARARRPRGAGRGGAPRASSTPTSSRAACRSTRARLAALARRGLDTVQLSLQDVDADGGRPDRRARRVATRKLEVARWVRALGLPLTLNVVLHRGNLERVREFDRAGRAARRRAARARQHAVPRLGAREPRRAPADARADRRGARGVAAAARERLRGKMEILFVLPDYHAGRPRACMDGWAPPLRRGHARTASRCRATRRGTIAGLAFENVRDRPLADDLERLAGVPRVPRRGLDAGAVPHLRRGARDFGGCRCQAFALTGDAAATDPACALSPAPRARGARVPRGG